MSKADNILQRVDESSGVIVTYKETTVYYDGSPMTDAKCDGDIFRKKGNKYYWKQIDPTTLLKVSSIAELRLLNGYYEGQEIQLTGYYTAGDKDPVIYKFSLGTGVDDGGSVINSTVGKWTAKFEGKVSIRDFGAIESNPSINSLVNKVISFCAGKYSVYIPKGTWNIEPINVNNSGSINLVDNTSLIVDGVLKVQTNNFTHYNIIMGNAVNDCYISGSGTITGDKDTHTGTTGEWGNGISIINGCKNIYIENINFINCWGDGIFVGANGNTYPQNINVTVQNVTCNNNRRQGMSITHVNQMFVRDSIFSNTSGALPSAGIDIEPDFGQKAENVYINNIQCTGNAGGGLAIDNPQRLNAYINNVVVNNSSFNQNRVGIGITSASNIVISESEVKSNQIYGISVERDCKNLNIVSSKVYSNGSTGIAVITGGQDVGTENITVDKCYVYNNGQLVNGDGMRVDSDSSKYVRNVNVINTMFEDTQSTKTQSYGFSKKYNDTTISNINLRYTSFLNNKEGSYIGDLINAVLDNNIPKTFLTESDITSGMKIGDFAFYTNFSQLRFYNGSTWVHIMRAATQTSDGIVYKSRPVGNVIEADATDLPTAITLVNALKSRLNAKLQADRDSGQQD